MFAMLAFYSIPIFLLSILAIYARERRPAWYARTKALPMLWILGFSALWLFTRTSFFASVPELWILAGLVLGLGGDVFLLKKKYFLAGYLCFAAGHVSYIVGFFSLGGFLLSWYETALVGLPGLFYALYVSRRTSQKSKIPLIVAYAAIITLMLLSAINLGKGSSEGYPLVLGALLFCLSDGFWSWHNFVQPLKRPGVWILSTYYAGQALIAWGSFADIL